MFALSKLTKHDGVRAVLITALCTMLLAISPTATVAQNITTKNNRHALFIGIGQYNDPSVPSLPGIGHDMVSAQRIADAMAIPRQNQLLLRDKDATSDRIREAIKSLNDRVRDGDRVFVYYSGHGTRWLDPARQSCTEGLLAADNKALPNRLMAKMLSPIASKADKMFVFYDACFSGGMATSPLRTRGLPKSLGDLTPKFTAIGASEQCAKPSNFRTRTLALVMKEKGSVPDNLVTVAATRPDEVSFDSASTGGLATSTWRDCFLGSARDLDSSGAITVSEVTDCAQQQINKRLAKAPGIEGQNLTLAGNKSFVPAWIAQAMPVPVASISPPPTTTPVVSAAISKPVSEPVAVARPVVPAAILREVFMQRDANREVNVKLARSALRINQDALAMTIRSNRPGFVYIAIAGSDDESLYLLYPNEIDPDNMLAPGQALVLPRDSWETVAAGPVGRDTLLVMVTDSPRRLDQLRAEAAGPFMKALLDDSGRSRLQSVLVNGDLPPICATRLGRNILKERNSSCSDAFGAALVTVEEVE